MKQNVPSVSTPKPRRPLRRYLEVASRLRSLVACIAAGFAFGLNLPAQALEPGKIWVASWTASPQGPYPAGWAVAQPDLSFALPRGDTDGATDQTFRLIVKPDLWSKTIPLRLANTFDGRHGPFAQVHRIRLGHRPLKHSSLDLQTGIGSAWSVTEALDFGKHVLIRFAQAPDLQDQQRFTVRVNKATRQVTAKGD